MAFFTATAQRARRADRPPRRVARADRPPRRRARAAHLGALGMVAVLFVAGAATAGAAARNSLHRGIGPLGTAMGQPADGYVALGDSYASGAMVAPPAGGPARCLRSARDYPHLVARLLGLHLTDASCSGATTADMPAPEALGTGEAPPQLDALTPATAVVTLGVGGDNLGFARVISSCLAASPWGPTAVGWSCRSHYDPAGSDQLAARTAAVAPKLAAVLDDVHRRAPDAAVFLVGYPDILPASGDGCWPRVAFTRTDVSYLNGVEVGLNAMLRSVALGHGATYVDTYAPSTAHDACAPEGSRWLQPLLPSTSALPLHPNATGEAALATTVAAALRARGLGIALTR